MPQNKLILKSNRHFFESVKVKLTPQQKLKHLKVLLKIFHSNSKNTIYS